jgi:hypothetical protein
MLSGDSLEGTLNGGASEIEPHSTVILRLIGYSSPAGRKRGRKIFFRAVDPMAYLDVTLCIASAFNLAEVFTNPVAHKDRWYVKHFRASSIGRLGRC